LIPVTEIRYKNYISNGRGMLGYVDDHKLSPRDNSGNVFVFANGNIHSLGITEAMPVPLSEAFMDKIRFHLHPSSTEHEWHYLSETGVAIVCDKQQNKYYLKSAYPIKICKEIRSVHHLQNMWFYLFDEELPIQGSWEL